MFCGVCFQENVSSCSNTITWIQCSLSVQCGSTMHATRHNYAKMNTTMSCVNIVYHSCSSRWTVIISCVRIIIIIHLP